MTLAQLIAAGVPPTQARTFLEPLAAACARFHITTPVRIGAFIAQCRVESADFTQLEENLYYTTAERIRAVFPSKVPSLGAAAELVRNPKALANRVYAGRLGNGDAASGDPWRFIGRGLKQLTGRDNYTNAANELAFDYIGHPELVATPAHACLTAAWFFERAKGNLLADSAQWDAITRAINGPAMLLSDLRAQYSEAAARAFA